VLIFILIRYFYGDFMVNNGFIFIRFVMMFSFDLLLGFYILNSIITFLSYILIMGLLLKFLEMLQIRLEI
jgi:hypothetical protein